MTEGKEVMGNEDCKGEIYRRYCGVCEEVCRTVWDFGVLACDRTGSAGIRMG